MEADTHPGMPPSDGGVQRSIPWRPPVQADSEQPEPIPSGLRVGLRRLGSYLGGLIALFPYAVGLRRRLNAMPADFHPHDIEADFFGINVAPGRTPEHNRYVIERLGELGIRRVRINHGYHASESGELVPLFVRELHAAGFKVLLNLVPPMSDAIRMGAAEVDSRWRRFCDQTLSELRPFIDACEIGSAVNRFKWSGFTHTAYARAAAIAGPICRRHGIARLGPNVTDFEPLENMFYLAAMRRRRCLPDVNTDNLFVDRANQPETSDPNVLGISLSKRVSFDTVGKARLLSAIGLVAGAPRRTLSTYAYWTLNFGGTPRRRYVSLEQDARYLVRYLTLGAACGHLAGMYWGQFISYTKGLIDDGTNYKPEPPTVHHLWWVRGEVKDYRVRPAFLAFRALLERIQGARFKTRHAARPGTYLLEFERPDGQRLLVAWTRDGLEDSLAAYLSGGQENLTVHDVYGRPIALKGGRVPPITESPIFVSWRGGPPKPPSHEHLCNALIAYAVPECIGLGMVKFERGPWRGAMRSRLQGLDLADRLGDPEALFAGERVQTLREGGRSRMAVIPVPDSCKSAVEAEAMTIKRFPPRLFRQDGLSRAARTWNSVCEMISRNVPTALPVAFVERARRPWRSESYLLLEKIEGAIDLREMLEACRRNAPLPLGMERGQFIRELAAFIRSVHDCGVWHRDMTGGNILVRRKTDPARPDRLLEFFLLDVSRSRFAIKFRSLSAPLHDLVRVRLAPEDRRPFIEAYSGSPGKARRLWRRYMARLALHRTVRALKRWARPWRRKRD